MLLLNAFDTFNIMLFNDSQIFLFYLKIGNAPLAHLTRTMKDVGVASLAWSPAGLGPNGSCLLAVCTNSGHLNVYRAPTEPLAINWNQVCFFIFSNLGYFNK